MKCRKNNNENLVDRMFDKYVFFHNVRPCLWTSGSIENFNILKLLSNNLYSFNNVVDYYESVTDDKYSEQCLEWLLEKEELFDELIEREMLSAYELRHLLSKIKYLPELECLCKCTPLIMKILEDFLLDAMTVKRFNYLIVDYDTPSMFDIIEEHHKEYQTLLYLNEANKYTYLFDNFNKKQKLELTELLRQSERAQERLKQLIDNYLEDTYDFETLRKILTKDDNKTLRTRFNL